MIAERPGLRRSRVLLALGPAVLVFLVALLTMWSLTRQARTEIAVTRAHAAESELARLVLRLVDAETAQRGFVITGDEQYLAPYQGARADVARALTRLDTLLQDGAPARDLAALRPLVERRFVLIDSALALRRASGRDAAFAFILRGQGLAAMDGVRQRVQAMRAGEERLITERKLGERRFRDAALWVLGLGATLAGVLAFLANLLLARQAAELAEQGAAAQRSATQLRQSERRFRLLVEQVSDHALFLLDTDGRVRSWNRGAERLLGWREPEVLGQHAGVFLPPDAALAARLEGCLQRAAREGRATDEGWRVRSDGTRFWAEVVLTALREDDGVLAGVASVVRDRTEQRETAARLEEKEQRLAGIIASAMDAIITTDDAQRIVLFNRAAEEMFKYSAAEVLGQPLDVLLPDRFRGMHGGHVVGFGRTGVTNRSMHSPGLLSARRSDGSEFPIEASISQVTTSAGRFFTVILRDISRRLASEAALRRSESRLSFLAEASGRLAASLDLATTVEEITRIAVPRLGDACVLDLVEPDGRLRRHASGRDDDAAAGRLATLVNDQPPGRVEGTLAARVLATGEPVIVPRATPERLATAGVPSRAPEAAFAGTITAMTAWPLRSRGQTLGALTVLATTARPDGRDDQAAALVGDLAQRAAIAIDNARLYATSQQASEWTGFLAAASAALAQSVEYEVALQEVAMLAVPLLADYCLIDVAEADGVFRRVGVAHREPARAAWLDAQRTTVADPAAGARIGEVLRTGEPALVADLSPATLHEITADEQHLERLRRLGATSALYVPLVAPGDFAGHGLPTADGRRRVIGMLTLATTGDRPRYTADDEARAMELAARIGVVLERVRLHREAVAARAEAEAASRAKSTFLATMSHELRTPLNAIIGYTELLELGIAGPVTDAQRGYHARVRSSGRHLLGLISEVLDLAKVEAGQLTVRSERAPLSGSIGEALALVRPQAAVRQLAVTALPCREASYFGDPDRVRQILVNLLSNAVKFTAVGGAVTVRCGVSDRPDRGVRLPGSGPWTYVRVTDTGSGIPYDKQELVFEPFVQVEGDRPGTYTRTQGGTGLGLSISRQLARLMSGDLTLESRPGEGSTFTLWLPADPSPEPRPLRRTTPGGMAVVPGPGAAAPRTNGAVRADAGPGTGAEVRRVLGTAAPEVVRRVFERLRADPSTPGAHHLPAAELESHVAAFVADLAQQFAILDAARGEREPLLRDGAEIGRLILARHGAHRRRSGWSEEALRHEFGVLREELEGALRRGAGLSVDTVREALALVRAFLAEAAEASVDAYRQAAREAEVAAGT